MALITFTSIIVLAFILAFIISSASESTYIHILLIGKSFDSRKTIVIRRKRKDFNWSDATLRKLMLDAIKSLQKVGIKPKNVRIIVWEFGRTFKGEDLMKKNWWKYGSTTRL